MAIPASAALDDARWDVVKASVFGDSGLPSMQWNASPNDVFGDEVIRPVFDPGVWSNMLSQSSRLNRAIRVLAKNTVGLGWDLPPRIPEDEMTKTQLERYRRECDRIGKFFDAPNPDPMMSTPELFERMKIDEEGAGDGWMEVVRDRNGRPAALYHAVTSSMRISIQGTPSGGRKLLQVRRGGTQKRWFVPYGDPAILDPNTGMPASLAHGARASEMLHTAIYTPDDDWYGGPRYSSAAAAIMATRLGQQWNINFLKNSAHMPYAIILEGGQLTEASREMVKGFLDREGKGVSNAGKVLLLEPELNDAPPGHQNAVKIRLEKIAVGLADDGSFLKLREADIEEVRESLGLAKIMLGTFTDVNKSNAIIALRVTVQQEIEPDIIKKESLVNRTLMKDLGANFCKFKFRRPKVLDALQEASVVSKMMSGLSFNEIREMAGHVLGRRFPPIDSDVARVPTGFFTDAKMTAEADLLVGQVSKKLADTIEQSHTGVPELGSSLLPEVTNGHSRLLPAGFAVPA